MKKYFILLLFLGFYGFSQVEPVKKETVTVNEIKGGVPPMVAKSAEDEIDFEKPFSIEEVDTTPLFKECKKINKHEQKDCFEKYLFDHVKKNFNYPEEAIENNIQGKISVSFEIDNEGNVTNIKALSSNNVKILEDTVVEMMQKLPKLIPATYNGKNVSVKHNFPVVFSLK